MVARMGVSRRRGLLLLALVIVAGVVVSVYLEAQSRGLVGPEYVAVLELSGTIAYEESPLSLFGGATLTPEAVKDMVEQVEQDPKARAVVLVINSPGGSAVASEEIYQILRELSEDRVVVSYISEYGASGGYYIALAGDVVVASPSSLTGSVGAIALLINYADLMEKLGVKAETFKSGPMKDIGSPWRPMTDEERQVMQSMIDSIASTFQERVRKVRGDKIKDWDDVLTARPYTGVQAMEVGLVDQVGTLEDAINVARRMAGLPEDAPTYTIRPRAPGLLEVLFGGGVRKSLTLSYEVLLMWPLPTLSDPHYVILSGACLRG